MSEDTHVTPYGMIGGEEGVRRLVDRFYDLMDTAPEAAEIRAMHARSLKVSREKLFLFLTGWMGGPPLYVERYGQPQAPAPPTSPPIRLPPRDQWNVVHAAPPGPSRQYVRRSSGYLVDRIPGWRSTIPPTGGSRTTKVPLPP